MVWIDFLHEWQNPKDVDPRFRHYCMNELPSADRKQIVLINQVLAHDINVGYHQMTGVVDRINGTRITEMKDVMAAFDRPSNKHHLIEVDNHAGPWGYSDVNSAGTTIISGQASHSLNLSFGLSARSRSGDSGTPSVGDR